jgi:AcrR family transcriptional regulator
MSAKDSKTPTFKKQIIQEAAARLFRDRGYRATSMRDLAAAVDLKASSLYNHIRSKEELLRAICFENARRFLAGMKTVEEAPLNAAQKVRRLIGLHIRIATEDVTSVTAFNDEWRHLPEPHLSEFKALRRNYENRFKAIIEAGIAEGMLKPLNSSIVLFTIFSAIRWLYDWYRPGREVDAQTLENNIAELLMRGLNKS